MSKKHIIILITLIILGGALRVYDLGHQSFWYDEAASVKVSGNSFYDIFIGKARDLGNPPFYYMLLHFWMKLFGAGEAGVRLLGAIFGALAILLAYPLARRLIGARAALYTVFLLAISPWHIYLAQEARVFTLLVLLWMLSFYLLLKCLDDSRNILCWAGYILSTFLCLYSHYYSFFLVLTQLFLAFYLRKNNALFFKGVLASIFLIAAIYSPWVSVMLLQAKTRGDPLFSWVQGLFGLPVYSAVGRTLIWKGSKMLAVGVYVLLIAFFFWVPWLRGAFFLRKHAGRVSAKVVFFWLFIPLSAAFVVSLIRIPLITERYLLVISLPILLLMGLGLESISNKRSRAFLMSGITVLCAISLFNYYTKPYKPDWRLAAAHLSRMALPDDIIMFDPDFERSSFGYYFKGGNELVALDSEPDYKSARLMGQGLRGGAWADLSAQVEDSGRVWLIQSDANLHSGTFYLRWLEKRMKLAGREEFHRIGVYLFLKE